MALCLPFLVSSASPAETTAEEADINRENLYTVAFTVRPGSNYDGLSFAVACMQLKRLPGVKTVDLASDAIGEGVNDALKANEELHFLVDETGVVSLRQIKGLCIANEDWKQPLE